MVGVHQVETHLPVGRRSEETLVEGILEVGAAPSVGILVPVPVVDEGVDPVLERSADPFLDHLRVVVQFIAPKGLLGLVVAFETGRSLLDDFPFAFAVRPEPAVRQRIVVTGRPDVGADAVIRLLLREAGQAQQQCACEREDSFHGYRRSGH